MDSIRLYFKFYLKVRFAQFFNFDSLPGEFYLQISQTNQCEENLFRKLSYLIVPQVPSNEKI